MPLFTRDNAAIASAKGNQVRWSRWRAEREQSKAPLIPAVIAAIPSEPAPILAESDTFTSARLNRVRKQLDLVDTAIEEEASSKEPDGQRINWLATAQERLAEQERVLAGRPLPGSRRPAPDGRRDRQSPRSFAPSAAEVAPVPPIEPKPLTP